MREIFRQVRDYVKQNFDLPLYLGVGILAAIALYFNYTYDLEDGVIDRMSQPWRFLSMFAFHLVPYLAVCVLLSWRMNLTSWQRSKGFWIRILIGFSILAFDRSSSVYALFEPHFEGVNLSYILRVVSKLKSLITMVIPLILMSVLLERDRDTRLYGFKITYFNARPYLVLLGLASIAIIIGGFFQDIQEYYPRYIEVNGQRFAQVNNIPNWLNACIYELAYGSDFVSVELFFRGFLIVGMVRFFGPQVVLPMILTYCFLHFGKPLTESISSLFGGYILGIISLHSKSIWGGVMIHVGIAWLMEIVGYLFRL
jgi:hypothetical protein